MKEAPKLIILLCGVVTATMAGIVIGKKVTENTLVCRDVYGSHIRTFRDVKDFSEYGNSLIVWNEKRGTSIHILPQGTWCSLE